MRARAQVAALTHKGAAMNGLGRHKDAGSPLLAAHTAAAAAGDTVAQLLAAQHLTVALLHSARLPAARCAS